MTLEINGHDYELKMTFKALKAFDIVNDDFQKNTEKIGNIVMGIVGGDVFALKSALVAMTGNSSNTVQEDLENADNLDDAFGAVENLLLESPLTKKTVKMVYEPIKDGFKQAEEKMMKAVQEAK
ncbi:tail assembly chaperone [Fructobacillus ficulneus]|uniref:Prohead core scaffold protein n=1 Tax=Fructobacillus ficulneus TaxID=157463 RepID=A0A0K8MH86_9LACO|nr:tail assembly chaperone [Fructobacillus ficulneus]GAO99832.1 prohead core scaffold protein [Fructobacillus ficulneus]